jgi:hypothetical protein
MWGICYEGLSRIEHESREVWREVCRLDGEWELFGERLGMIGGRTLRGDAAREGSWCQCDVKQSSAFCR